MRAELGRSAGVVVGRDAEFAVLAQAHASLVERSAVTFVVGEPGMGKSGLWAGAVDRAANAGAIVLLARPSEAEHGAPWSGLADLLAVVPPAVLDQLPPPQRNAVDAVCLREEPAGGHLDQRAVWTAFRSVVLTLARAGPVLVAVDDLHWLDIATARALASLGRRLPDRGVGIFCTLRPPPSRGAIRELVEVPDAERMELAPLPRAATGEAIRRHLGVVLSGPTLERVHVAAGGNPMFAIELARATTHRAGRPPAVPPSLRELVDRRVEAASLDVRTTLAALAAARITTTQLAAAGLDAGLADAEAADLARTEGPWPVPSHPLVGAAAYARCAAATRRSIHARLAEVVDSEHQRARHAALGTANPGAALLAALDDAAAGAAARGAPDAAADLAALALDLTPPGEEARWARHLAAGEYHFRSGDSAIALGHFRLVLDEARIPALRARAAIRLTELAWETESAEVAAGHATLACRLSVGLPELNAEAEVCRARALSAVDLEESANAAGRALALLDGRPDVDRELLASALLASAETDFEIGRGLDRIRYEQAIALEGELPPARVADRASASLAALLKFADDLDGCRRALAHLRDAIEREGDESSLPFLVGHTVQLELWAGRWDVARRAAAEHLALAERTGQEAQRRQADYNIALIAVHSGDEAQAEQIAEQLAAEAREDGDAWTELTAVNILGFAAFTRGEYDRAVDQFDIGYGIAEGMALREPGRTRSRTDYVESLVAIGERKRAESLLDEYEERARAVRRVSALGAVARCRALIAASIGDLEAAMAAGAESLREYERATQGRFVFERARTLLVVGRLDRRLRQKRTARVALTEARDVFAALGARRFVEQADDELARLGSRPRTATELTVTERRVAELAAQGLTTRQVADAAFLSPKTVEANLTRVYRKLGLRSRAELGAWHAGQRPTGGEVT